MNATQSEPFGDTRPADIGTKIGEFAAFCVLHIEARKPSVAEYVENKEIQPIKDAHRRIFGCDPSGATIVRIVGRNLLKEVSPGMFIHTACGITADWPQYLLRTIDLCGIETKIVQGSDIP